MVKSSLLHDPKPIEQSLANIEHGFRIYSEFLFQFHINKDNVLLCVCENGNIEALTFLLTLGVNVNINRTHYEGKIALHQAVRSGHTKCVRLLLEHKAFTNVTNKDGETPLYIAANLGNLECVKLLLEHNADPNYKTYVITPPDRAVFPYKAKRTVNHTECVQWLFKFSADPNMSVLMGTHHCTWQ